MHGLATGEESGSSLYTMLTRGRVANHLYLQVVEDGDPHSILWPETVRPATATDLLEQILARDDAARSATTLLSDQHHPAVRLADAAQRYVDALHVAAEDLAGPEVVAAFEKTAEQAVPGLADEPAWPALRARLLLLSAAGIDPIAQLLSAVDTRELDSAVDHAAVLGWRLGGTGTPDPVRTPGPPAIPQHLKHMRCGKLFDRPSRDRRELAARIRASANGQRPTWAGRVGTTIPSDRASVWRAAMGVGQTTGAPPVKFSDTRRADLAAPPRPGAGRRRGARVAQWRRLVTQLAPNAAKTVKADSGRPLGRHLSRWWTPNSCTVAVLNRYQTIMPQRHCGGGSAVISTQALSAQINRPAVPTVRESGLQLIGTDRAQLIQTSPWWPALVTAVDHALQRGWRLEDLISAPDSGLSPTDVDQCQAMVWRISIALDRVSQATEVSRVRVLCTMTHGRLVSRPPRRAH